MKSLPTLANKSFPQFLMFQWDIFFLLIFRCSFFKNVFLIYESFARSLCHKYLLPLLIFTYTIRSSVNNFHFNSTFLIVIPFISFSCFLVLPRSSSVMLSRNSCIEHPCLRSKFGFHHFVACRGKSFCRCTSSN